MKELITTLSIIIGIVLITSMFCIFINSGKVDAKIDSRFAFVNSEPYFNIYYDKKTKVMYAVSDSQYNRGNVVLLVDADGKPLLYEGGQ